MKKNALLFSERGLPQLFARFLTLPQVMIEMKNKETPFCESAQRTESYVTGEQKGVDDVIRSIIT